MNKTTPIPEISDEEFIKLFEEGDEYLEYCDLDNIRRPALESRTVVFDLPKYTFDAVVNEAANAGIDFRDLIAGWISERVSKTSAY